MIAALKPRSSSACTSTWGIPTSIARSPKSRSSSPEDAEALFHAVQQKDAPAAAEIAVAASGDALAALTALNGGVEAIAARAARLPANPAIAQRSTLSTGSRRCAAAGRRRLGRPRRAGRLQLRKRPAFAAFAPGSPDAIARGGRYDEVGASFGRARVRHRIHHGPAPARRARAAPPSAARCSRPRWTTRRSRRDREAARGGEVVVVDMPGTRRTREELGCDRRLGTKDGKWRVT
jgi:ATP phosphoribosyltransferase regulatory subunit